MRLIASVLVSQGESSPWREVNKTDVNRGVDKLISNLSLNRLTSVLPFLEGTDLENIVMSAAIRSNPKRGCVSLLPSTALFSVCVCVLFLRRSILWWPVCVCLCVRWGAEVSTLVCLGSLQEICTDELMVAEQWCRRCPRGREKDSKGERESERMERSRCSIPPCPAPRI